MLQGLCAADVLYSPHLALVSHHLIINYVGLSLLMVVVPGLIAACLARVWLHEIAKSVDFASYFFGTGTVKAVGF